jgi:predicted nucleotidyltransferase
MVIDLEELNKKLKDYAKDVEKVFPLDKAVLFGSYAKGTAVWDSDVDVCFFSEAFTAMRRVDAIAELLHIAGKYDIWIEPIAFSTSELFNDNPFVKEVLRTGREISLS